MNRWLTSDIMYHDVLHGFRAGRETGTAALEAKMLQQLMSMRQAVLFEVFLDLKKAYKALDRDMCLEILATYGVGPRTLQLLRTYWDRLTMVARSGRYFRHLLKGYQGLMKGNPLSPMIFNVVVDSVIHH